MTTSTEQPRGVQRPERRIIERPRLIKLLDESEARIILLLAPAGYGKTTLARQWFKTLNKAIWISLTPAHNDIAPFADDFATAIGGADGEGTRFVREYVRSRGNPQRAPREIGGVLADQLAEARVRWIVLDDYHNVDESPELAEILAVLGEKAGARLLVTSRTRPRWATSRRVVYGEINEVGRSELAMDSEESRLLIGARSDASQLVDTAQGWPAVLALAASSKANTPSGIVPGALYQFFAEELYRSAPTELQEDLLRLALVPELSNEAVSAAVGRAAGEVVESLHQFGFASNESPEELHPLIREFLLEKLRERRGSAALARDAIDLCLASERWDRAFELVLRFSFDELIDLVVARSYRSLLRSGRLATLAAFARQVKVSAGFPPPSIDLVEAEVAMWDGNFGLAMALAKRVSEALEEDNELACRASLIIGHCAFVDADFATSASAYRDARATARDDNDVLDALYGWTSAAIQGELTGGEDAFAELERQRNRSPLDLVRFTTALLARRRFTGVRAAPPIEGAVHALSGVASPRARTALMYAISYDSALRTDYEQALEAAQSCNEDIDAYDLDFAKPYNDWNIAFANLGLRRFAAAEAAIQRVEDANRTAPVAFHVVNAHVLRMRLALTTGRLDNAMELALQQLSETNAVLPSLAGEECATRALCLAITGRFDEALVATEEAERTTHALEIRTLAATVRAVVEAEDHGSPKLRELFGLASRTGMWDPLLLGLRTSRALAAESSDVPQLRPILASVYDRSRDLALARRSGLRLRSRKAPNEVLSPREYEVLQLMAQGMRNRDIANALVISESTTKVHVRHVLEKLGVRTRTEAVARFEMFR